MNHKSQKFSVRHGLAGNQQGQLIYDDAPESLRVGFLALLEEDFEMRPSDMRSVICRVLRKSPDPSNWSEYPNVWWEVQYLVERCEWYRFFDIVEGFGKYFAKENKLELYSTVVNQLLQEEGIGWHLVEGLLEVRGDGSFERTVDEAFAKLAENGFAVASRELLEARHDLSRRPEPDLSGAITHAMAALEAVARAWSGEEKSTLGDIIRRRSDAFPAPLNEAVAKLWGFASNEARHGSEQRNLALSEALLLVGVSAALSSYLARKQQEVES